MGSDLFGDLPAPSQSSTTNDTNKTTTTTEWSTPPPPPALKSALKRSNPSSQPQDIVPERRIRFKTTTDASESQVIEAMQKIASHIKNPSKFSKASKLAIQLIQAGSVKPSTSDHFFAILEAAMSSPTICNEISVRADYHALFSAAQDAIECLNKKQQNLLTTWTFRAVVTNDLFTDDSFVFSKATGKIKEAVVSLPVATEEDDIEEAADFKEQMELVSAGGGMEEKPSSEESKQRETDPFGLDVLLESTSKKDDKGKRDVGVKRKEVQDEAKRFLKSQRQALISSLEIAANRYKIPWCQTAIDILVKHAYDNVSRFTTMQRDALTKLWVSVREQQTRRKQGKSVSGKLDVNAFEDLQQKYATEKISIRRAVGASGGRSCQQWLG
ncbi:hypothetical protein LIER_18408 [Lithospermum erythrorhizon]|uniref:Uncharacterized protein n=1 Tax=Lithospermum erythrorhizon TaxID=34254 RepID=A0AAV3QGG0_LITER